MKDLHPKWLVFISYWGFMSLVNLGLLHDPVRGIGPLVYDNFERSCIMIVFLFCVEGVISLIILDQLEGEKDGKKNTERR